MKALVCEMCGSQNLVKEDGMYVCQSCGTKYTTEEAKKLMIEGTVKIDDSKELANLYQLARRAKQNNNSEDAKKYYEQIVIKDPSSWEASFYSTYYQSMNCKIAEIGLAANRITNCEDSVFSLIKDNISDSDEQRKAVDEVAAALISISTMLFSAYKNYYDGIDIQIKERFVQGYANNCSAARDIVYAGGNLIIKNFGDKYGDIAASCWKVGVNLHNTLNTVFIDKQGNAKVIEEYNNKISMYDSNYQAPQTNMSGGGCYVATAVYGSYDCPEVWTLRRYRDDTLAKTWYGRAFIRTYYAVSPSLVKWFGNTNWFKNMWKPKLDKMVAQLNNEGVSNKPYNDRNW